MSTVGQKLPLDKLHSKTNTWPKEDGRVNAFRPDPSNMEDAPVRHAVGVIVATLGAILGITACSSPQRNPAPVSQVLFVCEHGNVKSLMAASYFNQLAQERQLSSRGVSRGTEPDSTTVPAAIIAGLRADGFDVSTFRPTAVRASDVAASQRVITIGAVLPAAAEVAATQVEQWNDVPAASTNYGASREVLKAHVAELVEQLAATESK